jgi:hypothetical protein
MSAELDAANHAKIKRFVGSLVEERRFVRPFIMVFASGDCCVLRLSVGAFVRPARISHCPNRRGWPVGDDHGRS